MWFYKTIDCLFLKSISRKMKVVVRQESVQNVETVI